MATATETGSPSSRGGFFFRTSWGAIIIGVFLVLGIMTLLMTFGNAVGFWIADPDADSMRGALWWIGIWTVISGIVSVFIGVFATGFLCRTLRRLDYIWHGLTTWAISVLIYLCILFWVLAMVMAGVTRMAATGLTATSAGLTTMVEEVVSAAADEIDVTAEELQQAVMEALRATDEEVLEPEQLRRSISRILRALLTEGGIERAQQIASQEAERIAEEVDRDSLATAIANSTEMSQQEARQLVDNLLPELERAIEQAANAVAVAAETAREGVVQAMDMMRDLMWYAFAFLLLTLIAAIGAAVLSMGSQNNPKYSRTIEVESQEQRPPREEPPAVREP